MRSTPLLPSLPGPLWLGEEAPYMGQIELFDIWIVCKQMPNAKLICLNWSFMWLMFNWIVSDTQQYLESFNVVELC